MTLTLTELTKDIANIDFEDILSSWQWCIADTKALAMMSCMGDLFFVGKDERVY